MTEQPASSAVPSVSKKTVAPLPRTGGVEIIKKKISDESAEKHQKTFGTLHLSATLMPDASPIETGLFWRIFATKPDLQGNFKVVASSKEASPLFQLIATDYIINVTYGQANTTQEITVLGGKILDRMIVLDAGGLRLKSVLPNGRDIPDDEVIYDIYAGEKDAMGNRKLVFPLASSNKIIRLNEGNYHVVSRYGSANATVEESIAVKAGRLSEAIVNHSAAKITLKLVYESGGEAIANTFWSILTPDGDVVAESVGAFPSHILAEGDYRIIARHEGISYDKAVSVRAGLDKEIDLLITPE